ncbi:MAG TPA: DNA repair protein RadC [Kofleriaceae bacterium]|jgi:DNA repair protein RadC|nr:DNA repair protein RadC [Kofleriaceae bacterium]
METAVEHPRERAWRRGTSSLGDRELLAMIVGGEDAIDALVESAGGIAELSRASPRELAQIAGIGPALATRIVAAFELGRRVIEMVHHRTTIGHAGDVHHLLAPRFAGMMQEVFLVVGVDIRNNLLDVVEVARGTVLGVEVHPREVFRPLIRMAAAGAVLVHNHPSGDPTPSQEDVDLTRRLREIGALLGIPIIDHVVIAETGYRSLAEWLGSDLDRATIHK